MLTTRGTLLIARKEVVSYLRDGRLQMTAAIILVLSALAAWVGISEYNARAEAQRAFAARERERWVKQDPTSPHAAAHHGIYAFQPQGSLSALEPGIARWAGQVVFLEAHYQNFFRFRLAEDHGASRRLGELSIATMIEILLPLVVTVLAFGAVAGERETGTLSLLLANGLNPGTFITGKLAGLMIAIGLALVPGLIVVLAVMWPRLPGCSLAILLAIYGGYLLQLAAVILSVSMFARSSRTALLFALLFWLWNCAIVPRIGVNLAAWLRPSPDALAVQAAVTEELTERSTLWDRRVEVNKRFLQQYAVTSLKDLPVNPDGILLMEQEEQDTRASAGNVQRVYEAQREQQEFYRWAGLIAPSIALHSLTMAFAASDVYHFQHFAQAAEQYRRKLVLQMNEATAYDHSIRVGTINPRAEALDVKAGRDFWEKVPPFEYTAPSLAEVLRENSFAIVVYLAWTIVAPALLLYSASRLYRVAL